MQTSAPSYDYHCALKNYQNRYYVNDNIFSFSNNKKKNHNQKRTKQVLDNKCAELEQRVQECSAETH